ncbi:MAG: hypothetical protein C0401_07750 [Anaerolinea sp.]|nr:hypothetical protein [Anaerolinea sp.]
MLLAITKLSASLSYTNNEHEESRKNHPVVYTNCLSQTHCAGYKRDRLAQIFLRDALLNKGYIRNISQHTSRPHHENDDTKNSKSGRGHDASNQ